MPEEQQPTPEEQQQQLAAAQAMMPAPEEIRYLINSITLSEKDANGFREFTFPVGPFKQYTFVVGPELQKFVLERLAGGIEVADLTQVQQAAAEALEAEEANGGRG